MSKGSFQKGSGWKSFTLVKFQHSKNYLCGKCGEAVSYINGYHVYDCPAKSTYFKGC